MLRLLRSMVLFQCQMPMAFVLMFTSQKRTFRQLWGQKHLSRRVLQGLKTLRLVRFCLECPNTHYQIQVVHLHHSWEQQSLAFWLPLAYYILRKKEEKNKANSVLFFFFHMFSVTYLALQTLTDFSSTGNSPQPWSSIVTI